MGSPLKVKHYFFVFNLVAYLFAIKEVLSFWIEGFAMLIMLSTFFSTFFTILTDKVYDYLNIFVAIPLNITLIASLFFAINYYSPNIEHQIEVNKAGLLGRDWVAHEDDLICRVHFFENDSVTFSYSEENSDFAYRFKIDGDKISFYDFDGDLFFEWQFMTFYQNTIRIIEDGELKLTFHAQTIDER